jgi:hypothetical protein
VAAGGVQAPPGADEGAKEPAGSGVQEPGAATAAAKVAAPLERSATTQGYWIGLGVGVLALLGFYALLTFQRLEIFKMLLSSFFPLVVLILGVLGSIVMGLATPTEAAAVGAFGGYLLAAVYSVINKHKTSRGRIFGTWLVLWAPALVSVGWFILEREGMLAAEVPKALGAAGALGVLAWALLAVGGLGTARFAAMQTSVVMTAARMEQEVEVVQLFIQKLIVSLVKYYLSRLAVAVVVALQMLLILVLVLQVQMVAVLGEMRVVQVGQEVVAVEEDGLVCMLAQLIIL